MDGREVPKGWEIKPLNDIAVLKTQTIQPKNFADKIWEHYRNPDGEEVPCPHLHTYREGYGYKWAIEVHSDQFPSIQEDSWQTLQDFMQYCNIVVPPDIQRGII